MSRHLAAEYGPQSPRVAFDLSLMEAAMKNSIDSSMLFWILGIVVSLAPPPPQ